MTRACLILLFLGFPALAADHVVLTNGDTITGAIVKKDGDKLTIKSEFLGEVTMPWKAVKSIQSDSELTVVLPSGETVKGKIASSGDQLQVTAGAQTKTAPMTGVTAVRDAGEQHTYERLLHPGPFDLWAGQFDFGLALARGNARSETLTTNFVAVRATRKNKVALYVNQIYGTARVENVTSTIASAIRSGWKYNRNFGVRMFATGFNDYEHDRFQNLNLRYVAGIGIGVRAAKTERAQLDFDGGGDFQHESFLNGLTRNSAEINTGDSAVYKLTKATSFNQAARVFIKVSDGSGYRFNFDLAAITVLKKWLGWSVNASDRFLSNPVQGRQRNDLLVSTGLRVTFAR